LKSYSMKWLPEIPLYAIIPLSSAGGLPPFVD